MTDQGLRRTSLSSQVAARLDEFLDTEGFAEGQAIPGTAELSKRFDVSPPVIREAVAQLVGRGRLSKSQGKATVLRAPGADDLSAMLRNSMLAHPRPVRQMHEYRTLLETGAARLAAERATAEEIAEMRSIVARMRGMPHGSTEFIPSDIELHRLMARSSGNTLLLLTMEALSQLLYDARVVGWKGWLGSGGGPAAIHDAHAAVIDAIDAGDAEAAARAMRAHLDQARAGINALEVAGRTERGDDMT